MYTNRFKDLKNPEYKNQPNMDYKIARYLFNQSSAEEEAEVSKMIENNFSDEQLYQLYKDVLNFIEQNCMNISEEKIDFAWTLYKEKFFAKH